MIEQGRGELLLHAADAVAVEAAAGQQSGEYLLHSGQAEAHLQLASEVAAELRAHHDAHAGPI